MHKKVIEERNAIEAQFVKCLAQKAQAAEQAIALQNVLHGFDAALQAVEADQASEE